MHDHAAEVHQDPRTAAVAFAVQKRLARRIHCLFYCIAEGLDMRVARRRADQKIVCQRRNVGNFNQTDILSELAVERLGGNRRNFLCRNHGFHPFFYGVSSV